jgi:ABC-type transporter Mla subunit MlaD
MQRPYGLAISDAIERGDSRRLQKLVDQAKELHEQQGGDLSKAIRSGESALKKLNKSGGAAAGGGSAKASSKSYKGR